MSASGWIGVDLDGCLAHYEGWNGGLIGKPVPAMQSRVKAWLAEGVEVRIVTARARGVHKAETPASGIRGDGVWGVDEYRDVVAPIRAWCEEHLGQVLTITNRKDFGMIELCDDRCVQVEMNTGCTEAERLSGIIDDLTGRLGDAAQVMDAVREWDNAGGDRDPEASRLLHNAYVNWHKAIETRDKELAKVNS